MQITNRHPEILSKSVIQDYAWCQIAPYCQCKSYQQFPKTSISFQLSQQGSESSREATFFMRASLEWRGRLHWTPGQGRKENYTGGCRTDLQEIYQGLWPDVAGDLAGGTPPSRIKSWAHMCICNRRLYQRGGPAGDWTCFIISFTSAQ